MGKSVFVSYKYSDKNVSTIGSRRDVTARDYVDMIAELLEKGDNVYQGEDDGEDLGSLADATIASKLGDKIFRSSVTIVIISSGMIDYSLPEKEQWIPWEISYSLKEQSRDYGNSKTNAVLAVVLPDLMGGYNYFIEDDTCPYCHCRTLKTNVLFQILRENMFNIKKPEYSECIYHVENKPLKGNSSFIYSVKWSEFIADVNKYIQIAVDIRSNINEYNIIKQVK